MFDSMNDASMTALLCDIEDRQRRLDAERAGVITEWDRRQVWANDGSASAAARLARETILSRQTARERVRVSAQLQSMPITNAELETLGWPKARLLANAINARTTDAMAYGELSP